MSKVEKKAWTPPVVHTIKEKELDRMIVAAACSVYYASCPADRTVRIGY